MYVNIRSLVITHRKSSVRRKKKNNFKNFQIYEIFLKVSNILGKIKIDYGWIILSIQTPHILTDLLN